MLETIKRAFNMGIYGKIQKITDWLEQNYNIRNCWVNFSYTVKNFPKEFRETCYYIGLKDADTIFAINYRFTNGKQYTLVALSPPMDENCKTDDYSVIFKRNYWQFQNRWFECFDENLYIKEKNPHKRVEEQVENIFIHLQNFCQTIELLTKQLKAMPTLQKIETDFTKTTEEV